MSLTGPWRVAGGLPAAFSSSELGPDGPGVQRETAPKVGMTFEALALGGWPESRERHFGGSHSQGPPGSVLWAKRTGTDFGSP